MDEEKQLKSLSPKQIGERISSRRKLLGITRTNLAEQMKVTSKFISDIENGDKGMSLQTLYKFMQTLEMSSDFILVGNCYDNKETENLKRIRENILTPLSSLEDKQLKFMEEVTKQYVQVLRGKGNDG
ncbi:MAG: helix-turn-helix transcriptional regulator [Eubacteriales bacterium]|nr:helix-turn-helix transcriptional regulator [Eubacteriales bacterium]MDD4390815.1 helix-turn-helix transcriptional regulator [Eubacteriales bacterium]